MTEFIPLDEVQWVPTRILKEHPERDDIHTSWRYQFDLPRPLADWDVFATWERERFDSMRQHLRPGMVLFDVGTEQGWCNLIYADMVGPENMVLIEPSSYFWPNIRATWRRNYSSGQMPRACYDGLLSDKTTDTRHGYFNTWPNCSDGPLIDRNSYQNLFDNAGRVPEMTLDDLVDRTRRPDAITIDVEGAELFVLRGAVGTLWEHRPLVWVSLHPDLMERDYGYTPDYVHKFMAGQGYRGTFLAQDHEQHYLFEPQ